MEDGDYGLPAGLSLGTLSVEPPDGRPVTTAIPGGRASGRLRRWRNVSRRVEHQGRRGGFRLTRPCTGLWVGTEEPPRLLSFKVTYHDSEREIAWAATGHSARRGIGRECDVGQGTRGGSRRESMLSWTCTVHWRACRRAFGKMSRISASTSGVRYSLVSRRLLPNGNWDGMVTRAGSSTDTSRACRLGSTLCGSSLTMRSLRCWQVTGDLGNGYMIWSSARLACASAARAMKAWSMFCFCVPSISLGASAR